MPWLILVFGKICKRCFADANQYVGNVVDTILTKLVVKCQCLENFSIFSFLKKTTTIEQHCSVGFGGTSAWNVKPYAMSLIVAVKIRTWKCHATQLKSSFCDWFLFVLFYKCWLYKFTEIYWTVKYPSSVISWARSLTIGPFSSRASSPSRISRVTYVTVVYF